MLSNFYLNKVVLEPGSQPRRSNFEVYGVITAKAFQLSKCYVKKLHAIFPNNYDVPFINPMLDLDWALFLTKIRREVGGEKLWALKKRVIIFKNFEVFGDDDDLLHYVFVRYKLSLHNDYEKLGVNQLINYIEQQKDYGNAFAYLTVSVDNHVIGSMLFEIYVKAVPKLSKHFLKLCLNESNGYAGKPIQRIVRPSWIQCGGWHMKHYKITCENYIIPHNKRGVLSMCNNGKHKDNNTQFMISLEPSPWMDCKYVAFGQLIHGESILHQIESIPTHYQEPLKNIIIAKCGLYDLCSTVDEKQLQALEKYLSRENDVTNMHHDVVDVRDAPSILLRNKYLKKYYSAKSDKNSHLPLNELPSSLFVRYVSTEKLSASPSTYETSLLSTVEDENKQTDLASDYLSSLKPVLRNVGFQKYKETNQIKTPV